MASVKIEGLYKTFGEYKAVNNVSLEIEQGEFFSLLGPSGCGKSTTLRLIAGFEDTEIGSIRIGDIDVSSLPPESRDVGFVFQNYAIFPHMNVYENIAFGLRLRKYKNDEIQKKVKSALQQVGLSGYEQRYQRELSGGQQQRVALARVLVTEPRILLLDEPLSALDKNLREEMKIWIKKLQTTLGITTIYVTHDQSEALTMSDRIAVMNQGRIEQIGHPREIYERPKNRFVSEFIGISNSIPCKIEKIQEDNVTVSVGTYQFLTKLDNDARTGDECLFILRPELISLEESDSRSDWNHLKMKVKSITYLGSIIRYEIISNDMLLLADVQNNLKGRKISLGDEVKVSWAIRSGRLILG